MAADDDLHEKIRRFGEDGSDSSPPSSDDRPSQVTIRFDSGKGKVKWGRTIVACMLAAGSVSEVVLELFSKGIITKIVGLFH